MSCYYMTERISSRGDGSYTNYRLNNPCIFKSDTYLGQGCPPNVLMDFPRVSTSPIPFTYDSIANAGSSYNALNSAYPVIVSAPFKLYSMTKY
jgi:hypothetical protein